MALLLCVRFSALAGDATPDDALKKQGLKLVGSLYVLESESDVHKKVGEIRKLARELKMSLMQQQSIASPEKYQETLDTLGDQIQGYRAEIQAVNLQISQMPLYNRGRFGYGGGVFGNTYAAGAYSQLVAYRTELQMELSQATAQLNQLKNQRPDPQAKQKLDTLVKENQESYDQTLLDLRKLVASTTEKYATLAKDEKISKALHALGKTAVVKPKLGPSPEFTANVKLLARLEKEKDLVGSRGVLDKPMRNSRRSSRSRGAAASVGAKGQDSGGSDR
jgi:hypothetical protein